MILSYDEFVDKMKLIPDKVVTANDASYNNVKVEGEHITYFRGSREFFAGKRNPLVEKLILKELFNAYTNLDFINRDLVRTYISRKQYAPSVAFLKASGLYDEKGNRVSIV
ncbi:MAG TPA: hypothetical protein PLD84_04830 [Chitinophagales bacterium]|nr:hypothetical protein [Chitinophagales bacterium]